jgi:hypothetical protein
LARNLPKGGGEDQRYTRFAGDPFDKINFPSRRFGIVGKHADTDVGHQATTLQEKLSQIREWYRSCDVIQGQSSLSRARSLRFSRMITASFIFELSCDEIIRLERVNVLKPIFVAAVDQIIAVNHLTLRYVKDGLAD